MSEQVAEPTAEAQTATEGAEAEPKTFDAEYVANLRKESAKYRTEAKVNADAAKRLAQIEEANKTEVQKAAERVAVAEQATADAMREALKFKVAAKYQIGDEDADLFLTGSDEDTLTKQAQRLAARETERKKQGNFVPREGTNPTTASSDERETVRALFRG